MKVLGCNSAGLVRVNKLLVAAPIIYCWRSDPPGAACEKPLSAFHQW